MNVTIEKEGTLDVLQIRIPIQQPAPSKSGKSLTIATSAGIVKTNVEVHGKPVSIGLNAFIAR